MFLLPTFWKFCLFVRFTKENLDKIFDWVQRNNENFRLCHTHTYTLNKSSCSRFGCSSMPFSSCAQLHDRKELEKRISIRMNCTLKMFTFVFIFESNALINNNNQQFACFPLITQKHTSLATKDNLMINFSNFNYFVLMQ